MKVFLILSLCLFAFFASLSQGQKQDEVFDPLLQASKNLELFELLRLVDALWQLEQRSGLTFEKDQAAALLVVLEPLTELQRLSPTEAKRLYQLAESLLNSRQQAWWLELRKAQEASVHKRSVQVHTLGKPSVYMLLPGYALILKKTMQGEAFNPFLLSPNDSHLQRLLLSLEAKL